MGWTSRAFEKSSTTISRRASKATYTESVGWSKPPQCKVIDCPSQVVLGVRDARGRLSRTSRTKMLHSSRRKCPAACLGSEISYCLLQDRERAAAIWIHRPRMDLEASQAIEDEASGDGQDQASGSREQCKTHWAQRCDQETVS